MHAALHGSRGFVLTRGIELWGLHGHLCTGVGEQDDGLAEQWLQMKIQNEVYRLLLR